jgi:hypothetical protein
VFETTLRSVLPRRLTQRSKSLRLEHEAVGRQSIGQALTFASVRSAEMRQWVSPPTEITASVCFPEALTGSYRPNCDSGTLGLLKCGSMSGFGKPDGP